jgi:hypothetical protein
VDSECNDYWILKKNSIPNQILIIVDTHVYRRTVLDYLEGVALSSDKRLASKDSVVIREIEQFGYILES